MKSGAAVFRAALTRTGGVPPTILLTLLMTVSTSLSAEVAGLPENLLPTAEERPVLCQRDYLTPDQARAVHEAVLQAYPGKESWDRYATFLRMRIQEGMGLSPWPGKVPLNPILHSRREYDGYAVTNVALETVPGYWLTGNLYEPLGVDPPYAAILHPHGHSAGPDGESGWLGHGRFKPDVQKRAAALARMGAVCLTIDMFGYGDQLAFLEEGAHRSAPAMRIQTWNSIRAIDFLIQMPEVDPLRLAVTGHSGGGTQTFLLSALDPRISVSVPVAMVSGWFFGGCPCESGLPIHRSESHFATNAMIAALSAPRHQLLISDGGDWTRWTPEEEFPFLKRVYGLYGREAHVSNRHLPDEGHNYGPGKRRLLYPYLADKLGLDLSRITDSSGKIDESFLTIEDPRKMWVFEAAHPVPETILRTVREIDDSLKTLQTF